jgi:hypothetical protein
LFSKESEQQKLKSVSTRIATKMNIREVTQPNTNPYKN